MIGRESYRILKISEKDADKKKILPLRLIFSLVPSIIYVLLISINLKIYRNNYFYKLIIFIISFFFFLIIHEGIHALFYAIYGKSEANFIWFFFRGE